MSRQPTGIRNIRFCGLSVVALLALGGLIPPAARGAGPHGVTGFDPEFDRVPFVRWVAEGKAGRIPWSLEVEPAELSTHQRLLQRIRLRIDGREFEKRRGNGRFLTLVQLEDMAGGVWQDHLTMDLDTLRPNIRAQEIHQAVFAFLLPGDYWLSVAICDTKSLDHSFNRRRIHVAPLRNDPLPGAWAGLPAVEFIEHVADAPDTWYLPATDARLNLPIDTVKPVHLHLVVNTTASQRSQGSMAAVRRNMAVVVPALKVLSRLGLKNGSIDVTALDLTQRRVTFEQKNVHELDWAGLRKVFSEMNPGIVDARTLAGEWKMRQFFQDEVAGLLKEAGAGLHVVIVLSGPAFLGDQPGAEAPAIAQSMGPDPVEPDRRLFYIRYRSPAAPRPQRPRLRAGARPIMPTPPVNMPMPPDDLERTVERFNAHLFDATSAEQFRRIVAAVMDQISKL